jgi:hypothetical protein
MSHVLFIWAMKGERDIHQARDVRDTNGLAAVDRAIKTIKRDLAAEVGKKEGSWLTWLRKKRCVHQATKKISFSKNGQR